MQFTNPFPSLLGMGSNQPDPYQSLLGEYYDPRQARMAWIGGTLQGLGAGLASGKSGAWAEGLALGGGEGLDNYRQRAVAGYALKQRKDEQDYQKQERDRKAAEEQAQKDAQAAWLANPEDKTLFAKAYPAQYASQYAQTLFPTAPSPADRYKSVGGNIYDTEAGAWITAPDGASGVSADVQSRKAAAAQLGLDPSDPAYKSYILTGKMPREDQAPLSATDKKAILEADDAVLANETVINQLESVITPDQSGKSLNDRAGYGVTANTQSWFARNDPTGFFDDQTGQATTDLNNVVLGQALSSLKSIFGAAPTEGERKILVDLQASVDKTPQERANIIKRAIGLAKIRLQYNKQRADGLRGQTYYKPGGGQPVVTQDGFTIEEVPGGQ